LILPSQAKSIGLHHKKLGGHITNIQTSNKSSQFRRSPPWVLPACLPACLPVCLPASPTRKNINNKTRGNTTMVKATPNKNQNTCTFMVKEKTKNNDFICTNQRDFELGFYPFCLI
jgi:hypothetical protein